MGTTLLIFILVLMQLFIYLDQPTNLNAGGLGLQIGFFISSLLADLSKQNKR